MQDFRHLLIYQRSHALCIIVHKTASGFRSGYAHLRSQLCRAVDGISSNIVEGCGASTRKEFARFLDMAIKSANETEHRLLAARDLHLLSPKEWRELAGETVEIRKMIYSYRRKILESDNGAG